jgi:rhodanese-related sulfurtransferase
MTFRITALALAGAVCVCLVSIAMAAEHTKDALKTVQERVAAKEAVLVDVREQSEWDEGHVAGAVLLPISVLKAGVEAEKLARIVPKNKIVYTYCAVGKRALAAGEILQKHGYDVRPLKAGYKDLLQAGFKKASP